MPPEAQAGLIAGIFMLAASFMGGTFMLLRRRNGAERRAVREKERPAGTVAVGDWVEMLTEIATTVAAEAVKPQTAAHSEMLDLMASQGKKQEARVEAVEAAVLSLKNVLSKILTVLEESNIIAREANGGTTTT